MSKRIKIGGIYIGGNEKIAVQSMSTYKLSDTLNAVKQAIELQRAGCDILRYSVLDTDDTKAIKEIKRQVKMPIVADIHFDYKLALSAISCGADKIRINPGNIGSDEKVRAVAEALSSSGIPCRVGSNTGSIEKEFLKKYGKSETALAESALKHVSTLEKNGVKNIVISVKSSDVKMMVNAYRYIAKKTDYPLHLGVTEAGTEYNGIIKNSIGIGALLLDGIGDTIRVSLSAAPIKEVVAGRAILSGLNLIDDQVDVVACPTCGRCEWDCMNFANEVSEYVKDIRKKLKIAVMGCVVNGPGEASDADIGIAGSKGECYIFKKGEIIKKLNKEKAKEEFFKEIDKCIR